MTETKFSVIVTRAPSDGYHVRVTDQADGEFAMARAADLWTALKMAVPYMAAAVEPDPFVRLGLSVTPSSAETSFAADLAQAKADRTPEMALRPVADDRPDEMDDIVVNDVTMFRAEAMSDTDWWLCCYFANGERVTFNMAARCKPKQLDCWVQEKPSEWRDIDAKS